MEAFLEATLLRGETTSAVPGVLSYEAALEILRVLSEAKEYNGTPLKRYLVGDSVPEILESLTNRGQT